MIASKEHVSNGFDIIKIFSSETFLFIVLRFITVCMSWLLMFALSAKPYPLALNDMSQYPVFLVSFCLKLDLRFRLLFALNPPFMSL
jgi:hypothetical protein